MKLETTIKIRSGCCYLNINLIFNYYFMSLYIRYIYILYLYHFYRDANFKKRKIFFGFTMKLETTIVIKIRSDCCYLIVVKLEMTIVIKIRSGCCYV